MSSPMVNTTAASTSTPIHDVKLPPEWADDDVVVVDPLDPTRNLAHAKPLRDAFRAAGDRLRRAQTMWYLQGGSMMTLLEATIKFADGYVDVESERDHETVNAVLQVDLDTVRANAVEASAFGAPEVDEDELVKLSRTVLLEQIRAGSGSCSVGKLGTLVHSRTNAHGLPALIKARFGGLKKLLERHRNVFTLGSDHPYNPNVFLNDISDLDELAGDLDALQCGAASRSSILQPQPQQAGLYPRKLPSANTTRKQGGKRRSRGSRSSSRHLSSNAVHSKKKSGREGVGGAAVESAVSQWLRQTLCCPISGFVMVDAVVASDGYTFERSALQAWTEQNGQVSPVTGQRLTGVTLPNRSLINLANLWRHLHPIPSGMAASTSSTSS